MVPHEVGPESLLEAPGCEQLEVLHDPRSGLRAFVVLDDTRLGPAFGGVRCRAYPDAVAALADALALARAMTRKCALAGLPAGGGKAVVVDHPRLARPAAFARLGQHVEALGGRFRTGPDAGTTSADLESMARHTRFVAHAGSEVGDIALPTALGVRAAIEAAARRLGFAGLAGVRVAIQGVGAVGGHLARLLAADGAVLAVADADAGRAAAVAQATGARRLAPEGVLTAECDVLAPCALGGVIDAGLVPRLRARAVVGAANNQLAGPEAGEALFAAGILHVPDFVANAGGVIHGALAVLEGRVPPPGRVLAIGARAEQILARSAAERRAPHAIALAMVEERLAAAPAGAYFPPPR